MRENLEQVLANIVGEHEQSVIHERSSSPEYKSFERRSINKLYEAMMEPSEGMIRAGDHAPSEDPYEWPGSRNIWQAMIKAAKEE